MDDLERIPVRVEYISGPLGLLHETGHWESKASAGIAVASAQHFDEPNGNVRLLAFEQHYGLLGEQQLLAGYQRREWTAQATFVSSHGIVPTL